VSGECLGGRQPDHSTADDDDVASAGRRHRVCPAGYSCPGRPGTAKLPQRLARIAGRRFQYLGICTEKDAMFRTFLTVGVFFLVGLFILKLFFGIFGGLLMVLLWLAFLALKIAIIGAIVYFVVRIVSPDTARRWRERWSGNSGF
jgi:hypothetical protein